MDSIRQTTAINVPTLQTSTTALASNTHRIAWSIQNQDTSPLKVCLGTPATTSVYHYVLKAGTGAADGTGGSCGEEVGAVYTGAIYVYSAGTPSYTCVEMAP